MVGVIPADNMSISRIIRVTYPMTMVFFNGILTDHGSPPSLQLIWMATLVATLIRPLGLFRTVAVMH